jgi:hypothetical protein
LAAVGACIVWLPLCNPIAEQVRLARFASLLVLLRTGELGALGTVAWGGLMEVRYILVGFPFALLLAFWGTKYLWRVRLSERLDMTRRSSR